MTEIKIADLKTVMNRLLDHIIEERHVDKITIRNPFYWNVPSDLIFDIPSDKILGPDDKPKNFYSGHLRDDWEFVSKLLNKHEKPVIYQLTVVAPLLQYIGKTLGVALAKGGGQERQRVRPKTSLNEEQSTLIEMIAEAFADNPYPGDNRLLENDGISEAPDIQREFSGKDWREISPGIGEGNVMYWSPDSLLWLSPEAFRYYLPAYLISCVEDAVKADVIPYTLLGVLNSYGWSPEFADYSKGKFERNVEPMTEEQKNAIRAFLQYALDSPIELRGILEVFPPSGVDDFMKFWNLK